MDVEVGLSVQIPDLVDSRLQLSVFKDGLGTTGRVQGHGKDKYLDAENTSSSRHYILPYTLAPCVTLFVDRTRILL